MVSVSVRELKQRTDAILGQVREGGETVAITNYGRVIAHLVPVVSSTRAEAKITAVLADMNHLSAEISARWPDGVTALEAVNDVRREL